MNQMNQIHAPRRALIKGIVGVAALQSLPNLTFASTPSRVRLEWQQFKTTSQYKSFLNAITAMRKNTNPLDPGSLQYWANVHETHCPHSSTYFISWHRGYLYYFEQQIRLSSGDPTLNLPYWDYYANATLPAEFTDPAPTNPLFMQRSSTNVYNALSLWPFAPAVFNYQRGLPDAFEFRIESIPHNPFHDLIGGIMSTLQSPLDPIFYLHHANIDRLTHAWALPDGKGIPETAYPYSPTNSDPYWAGVNIYAADLSIERFKTYNPTWLGYDYANDNVPTSLPPLSVTAQAGRTQMSSSVRLPANQRPPFMSFTAAPARQIGANRRSLGGAAQMALDEKSMSIRLTLSAKDAAAVASIITSQRNGKNGIDGGTVASVKLVIAQPRLSQRGSLGGYFYVMYLNMPPIIDSNTAYDQAFVGNLGAFQIAAASHHGPATLEFDLTTILARQQLTNFSEISISLVRVDGDSPPTGTMVNLQEARIDVSYEPAPAHPHLLKGLPGRYS